MSTPPPPRSPRDPISTPPPGRSRGVLKVLAYIVGGFALLLFIGLGLLAITCAGSIR
jgi:hypothetical protein